MLPCPYRIFKIQYFKKDGVTPHTTREFCELPGELERRRTQKYPILTERACTGHLLVNIGMDGEYEYEYMEVIWKCSQGHNINQRGILQTEGIPTIPFLADSLNEWVNKQLGYQCDNSQCRECHEWEINKIEETHE